MSSKAELTDGGVSVGSSIAGGTDIGPSVYVRTCKGTSFLKYSYMLTNMARALVYLGPVLGCFWR